MLEHNFSAGIKALGGLRACSLAEDLRSMHQLRHSRIVNSVRQSQICFALAAASASALCTHTQLYGVCPQHSLTPYTHFPHRSITTYYGMHILVYNLQPLVPQLLSTTGEAATCLNALLLRSQRNAVSHSRFCCCSFDVCLGTLNIPPDWHQRSGHDGLSFARRGWCRNSGFENTLVFLIKLVSGCEGPHRAANTPGARLTP
jgi:hypothetical protein